MRFINGDLTKKMIQPSEWGEENIIVKGWLINSVDISLISNFIRFPTARHVWDYVAITYFDGNDKSQVFDLKRRVSQMK